MLMLAWIWVSGVRWVVGLPQDSLLVGWVWDLPCCNVLFEFDDLVF